jgi:hypothetical protein
MTRREANQDGYRGAIWARYGVIAGLGVLGSAVALEQWTFDSPKPHEVTHAAQPHASASSLPQNCAESKLGKITDPQSGITLLSFKVGSCATGNALTMRNLPAENAPAAVVTEGDNATITPGEKLAVQCYTTAGSELWLNVTREGDNGPDTGFVPARIAGMSQLPKPQDGVLFQECGVGGE